jgi:uncharacterized protein (TIGR03437 family)
VMSLAPTLFAANGEVQGAAAAVLLRIQTSGGDHAQSIEPIVNFDPSRNRFVTAPIDLGSPDDQVFLVCFGTGLNRKSNDSTSSGSEGISVELRTIAGATQADVIYAGPQGEFEGLDQVNLRLPGSLAGSGDVELALYVNGVRSNTVQIKIK